MPLYQRLVLPFFLSASLAGCVDGVLFGPPTIDIVTITPDPATAANALTCSYSGFLGGEDTSTFAWTINGEPAGSVSELSEGFVRDDQVSCTVTPSNGKREGEPLTATVTIENAPATIDEVFISPDPAISSDILECEHGEAFDADGTNSFTYHYAWSVDGARVSTTEPTLGTNEFNRDAVVQCHVTANDGELDGIEQSSSEAVIGNTPPTVSGVVLSPMEPSEDDTIDCSYASFDDFDGDPDLSEFSWSINGVIAGAEAYLSGGFKNGDTVTCTVTPFDGTDYGAPLSMSAFVADPVTCSETGDGYWVASWASEECEVLDETNYRRSLGADCGTMGVYPPAGPLTMNANLRLAARLHSEWMAENETFSHDSPGGPNGDNLTERVESAGYKPWYALAENIAAGHLTPYDVVQGWMDSDGHCKNIMNATYDEIGVGYYYDASSSYKHWWTQNFGLQ